MSRIIMFASNQPFKEVPFPEDLEIHIDSKSRTADDGGGRDDGFGIFPCSGYLEIKTNMEYFAEPSWMEYPHGRAEGIIEYLRDHLKTTDEVELWNVWLDNSFDHRIRKRTIPIDELTADILLEIEQLPVGKEPKGQRLPYRRQSSRQTDQVSEWQEPVTDYLYVITNQ